MTMIEQLAGEFLATLQAAAMTAATAASDLALPTPALAALAGAGAGLLLGALAALGTRRQLRTQGARLEALGQQLGATDLVLAETTAALAQLRQKSEQIATRQDATAASVSRAGFRQAIALSRHGATTRQIMDTCGLSQGEAHLIQTLYGRATETATQTGGLH